MLKPKVNREKMFQLNKWEKGKPLGLVVMAEQLAVGAEGCIIGRW